MNWRKDKSGKRLDEVEWERGGGKKVKVLKRKKGKGF